MSKRLAASFYITMISLVFIQLAVFLGYALAFGFFRSYILQFLLASLGFNGMILALLFVFKNDFVREPSGEKLQAINLANKVTLLRISSLPTLLIIILASKDYPIKIPLVVLVVIVFSTDFLDGFISRIGNDRTRVGRMMDAASDYAILFVISIAYYYFHLIPLWLFALLTARLASQALMLLAVLIIKKSLKPETTIMGKIAVASTMVLFALELLRLLTSLPSIVYSIAEILVGAIMSISIIDKIIVMLRNLKTLQKADPKDGRLVTQTGEKDDN